MAAKKKVRSAVYLGPSGSITLRDGRGPFAQGERIIPLSAAEQTAVAGQGHLFGHVLEVDPSDLQAPPPPDETVWVQYLGPSASLESASGARAELGGTLQLRQSELRALREQGHDLVEAPAPPEPPLSEPADAESAPIPEPVEGEEGSAQA
jgi:hypothetical protein